MFEICGDNRFDIIKKAKDALIQGTNITGSPDEMKVLDSILFRAWQMGWLSQYAPDNKEDSKAAYRPTDGMNFGLAIEVAKMGKRIARKGWNGKNMSVAYQKGYPDGIPCNKNTAEAWGMQEGELFKCRPYLQMRCADGTFQMWLASQSDILADDWYVVE